MKLVVVPAALAELRDAAAFYAERGGVELGLALVAEFERTAQLVLDKPDWGMKFRGSFRRRLLRRFPYSIIYQMADGEVRIIAVAHHRRRPGYWGGRR